MEVGETAVQRHRLGATAGTVRRREKQMIHAKYDDDRRTVRSTIDGSVLDIVGELAALIEAVRNTLKEQYNETAVDEVIVNIGRAAYSEEPQRVEDICKPLHKKKKKDGETWEIKSLHLALSNTMACSTRPNLDGQKRSIWCPGMARTRR